MKVYVATKALLFKSEEYLFVKASKKEAEKELRKMYPYMRQSTGYDGDCRTIFAADGDSRMLLFIHEEEI